MSAAPKLKPPPKRRPPPVYTVEVEPAPSDPKAEAELVRWLKKRMEE